MAGAFRFPYQIDTLVPAAPELGPIVEYLMDRDRALEDYVTSTNPPFVTVASDGTGDYMSIKEAVEDISGTAVVWVKAGTYDDSGSGRATVATGAKITMFAGLSHIAIPGVTPTYQTWTCDGIDVSGSGTAFLTLVGIDLSTGSNAVVDTLSEGQNLHLAVQNGKVTSTGNMHTGFFTWGDLFLAFSDSVVTANMNPSGQKVAVIHGVRTTFSAFSSGSTSHQLNQGTSLWDVNLQDCVVTLGTLSWTASTSSLLPRIRLVGCRVSGTSWSISDPSNVQVSNCWGLPSSFTLNDTSAAGASGACLLTDNYAPTTSLTYNTGGLAGPSLRGSMLSGHYANVTLNTGKHTSFEAAGLVASLSVLSTLTVSGNSNIVSVVFPDDEASRTLTVSGDNNQVWYRSTFSVTVSNTGTGNNINSSPPSGAAGGDLSGTYPNPTVTNLIPKTLFDAKGDLLAASAADTAARLAVGTDGQFLTAASGETTGLQWATHGTSGDPHTQYVQESLFDAKGDIFAATAADTVARLAVGTDGQVLTADSGEATGLKWAAASDGLVPYFIPSGETYTVPEYRQALFIEPIDVEGVLDVEGLLIEVTQAPDLSAQFHMQTSL